MIPKYKLLQMHWRKKETQPFSVRFGYAPGTLRPDFCYATPGVLVLISSSGGQNQFRSTYFYGPIDYNSEYFVRKYYEEKIKEGELEFEEAPLNMLLTSKNKKVRSFIKGRVQEKYKKQEEFEILYEHPKFQAYLKSWLNGNKKFDPQQFFLDYRKKLYKEAKHLTKIKTITDRLKGERVVVTINVRRWSPQDVIVSDQFNDISGILEILKENQAYELPGGGIRWPLGDESGTFEKISDEQLRKIKKISPRMAKEIKKIRIEIYDLLEQAKIVTDFQGTNFNKDIQKVVWSR